MSLSSGGWTHTQTPAAPSASLPGYGASQSGCNTVLMSVRVSVCHSGIRPLCLPGAGDESLRLQLSMDPGKAGEFRLTLRDASGTAGRSVVGINHIHFVKCHSLWCEMVTKCIKTLSLNNLFIIWRVINVFMMLTACILKNDSPWSVRLQSRVVFIITSVTKGG